MPPVVFPPPHTYCDGVCARCPVLHSCELSGALARPVVRSPEQPGPFSIAREHVLKKSLVALDELTRLASRLPVDAPARMLVERAARAMGTLISSAARLDAAAGSTFQDFSPALLLLETLLARAEGLVTAAEAELGARLARSRRSIASIHEAIGPLVARVPPAFRAELARLVREGLAPSPFADG